MQRSHRAVERRHLSRLFVLVLVCAACRSPHHSTGESIEGVPGTIRPARNDGDFFGTLFASRKE